ncbi:response regulator [Goodfellowiella coeruleoviolacea]|uniref:Two component transcriptional regulator, LuxR family n=1 Tax=Goodfellowiella coeruleoviolacea TaxID=334858 RepID=A0AAE3GFN2_9PSEU|nr:response regulator transcription factor [Goodfellowiella coeruleoviolacea]MCP2166485.1 two component transcriptional regulator, LuxR family [Goodfellowiella coeruleoviolacea]
MGQTSAEGRSNPLMSDIRLAVVDAQPIFVRGLSALLSSMSQARVRVIASADQAGAAAGLVRRCRPDLALVDLGLPAPGGLRAIAAIHRTSPCLPIAAMSADNGTDLALAAMSAGASGILVKSAAPEDLLRPLLAMADGWAVVPRPALHRLASRAASGHDSRVAGLSDEDRQLWRLLAQGRSTAQVAAALHVSERTAKRLTATLLRRLRVATKAEAAALAGQAGLLDETA